MLEIEILPAANLRQRMLFKEFGRTTVPSEIPSRRLGSVFAEFRRIWFGRLAPGTTDAHEAAGLVLTQKLLTECHRTRTLAQDDGAETSERAPSSDCTFI